MSTLPLQTYSISGSTVLLSRCTASLHDALLEKLRAGIDIGYSLRFCLLFGLHHHNTAP